MSGERNRNSHGKEAKGRQEKRSRIQKYRRKFYGLTNSIVCIRGVGWKHHIKTIGDMLVFPIDYLSADFVMAYANVRVGIFKQALGIILTALGI